MPHQTHADVAELRRLIGEVRKTFRLMAGISDDMLEARGLTASLRAILEYLAEEGPSPVPKMAAAKSMTRQSVQALVDRLQTLGLVETRQNPEHRRSVLITLTDGGRAVFGEILAEEKTLLLRMGRGWEEGSLLQACRTLSDFQEKLTQLRRTSDVRDTETNA
ncbi:MarR family winged helix-turn-helix transcriptional regulator [Roseibium sp.]|uniref:MarR family winged helix-turn-helix transcriptional regulator n=1 Tax=Roseibium sp. TaxID=1936156 RepID=UPI003D0CE098